MKFTIGLPVTKTKYLKAALDSIANQNFSDYEIIIKNNGASEEKKKEIKSICDPYLKSKNVTYFESDQQLQMGPNFNTILEKAKGDFFMIMSDDDILEPNYLEEFNKLILKHPELDVFHCRIKLIDENDDLIIYSENCPELESRIDLLYNKLAYKRTMILSDFLVSTAVLKSIGGFTTGTTAYGLDEITWFKCCKKGVAYTSKVLLNYRNFRGNISFDPKNMKNRFKELVFLKNELEGIIRSEAENNLGIYSLDFLLDLNEKRLVLEKEYLFIDYAGSTNLPKTLLFYLQNMKNIQFKSLIKGVRATKSWL